MLYYLNSKIPVIITCPHHGDFYQQPSNHLDGKGCPICNQSKGEFSINNWLVNNNIEFDRQKKFIDCVNKFNLSFDFWIKDKNLLIEYDGMQHFKPLGFMGGDKKLEYTIKCDKIKNDYCFKNNIKLLRISYKEYKNIDKILFDYFN